MSQYGVDDLLLIVFVQALIVLKLTYFFEDLILLRKPFAKTANCEMLPQLEPLQCREPSLLFFGDQVDRFFTGDVGVHENYFSAQFFSTQALN